MVIDADPFASVAAAELKTPLVSVTDPVGVGVPETVIVAVTAVASVIVGDEKATAMDGAIGVTGAAGMVTVQVFDGTLGWLLFTVSA